MREARIKAYGWLRDFCSLKAEIAVLYELIINLY